MVEYGGLNHLLSVMRSKLHFSEQDVFLATSSLSFDVATAELLLPLVAGARLCLYDNLASDLNNVIATIGQQRATFMQATPSVWRVLLEEHSGPLLDGTILSAGEALTTELAGQLLRAGRKLWNLYGPSETTIYSLGAEITGEAEQVVVGRPLGETTAYIFDSQMQVVPVGVRGELYLGGPGVGR